MKISKIRIHNFRNFKGDLELDIPTDGRVTVIYGTNGVGKTTLHQFFQWVFYEKTHFNKTASDKMYNLQYEQEVGVSQTFEVWGEITFIHPDTDGIEREYAVSRKYVYRKEYKESRLIDKSFALVKHGKHGWTSDKSPDPSRTLEAILPSGLAQYFFFDGESMIADLSQKGQASAKSLKKALQRIFDLDIYEQALAHIGTRENPIKTSVFGKLYGLLEEGCSDKEILGYRTRYNQAVQIVDTLKQEIETLEKGVEDTKEKIKELSEKIGASPSHKDLEQRRKAAQASAKAFQTAIETEMRSFGSKIASSYPQLLMARIVEQAKNRIGLHVEEEKLMPGLTKELVKSLQKSVICLCGNPICEKEHATISDLLKMFPPLSYKFIYDQFKTSAARWSSDYDKTLLSPHFEKIFDYRERIDELARLIHDIDEEHKSHANVDDLIEQRKEAEAYLKRIEAALKKKVGDLGLAEPVTKRRKKELDDALAGQTSNEQYDVLFDVMQEVRKKLQAKMASSALHYSDALRDAIQTLLNAMLTSRRTVTITPDFVLSVKDSFGDEAKSEGQFAVVSFAYIGGIFKLLQNDENFKDRQFPLVLDGPFSKLDVIQRYNVISTIPMYAPQVILFSKDDLQDCLPEDVTVYTILSNDERNVSSIVNEYRPEVFISNGSNG